MILTEKSVISPLLQTQKFFQVIRGLMLAGQFLDENWSMARLNVHVAPRHAPLHVVSSDFLDFDIIPTCHKKKHVNISCWLC